MHGNSSDNYPYTGQSSPIILGPMQNTGNMSLLHRSRILLFLALLLSASGVMGQERRARFFSVWQENGQVLAHVEVTGLLDAELINGLQKGMTAALEYEVQLWQKRRWSDKVLESRYHRMKLAWDPWSKRYTVETRGNRPLLLSEDGLKKRCTEFERLRVAGIEKLIKGEHYYIAMKIILKPMSVENMDEITKWLSGEVKEIDTQHIGNAPRTKKKAGNWLMGMVLNLTGFGDRVITARSSRFTWREGDLDLDAQRER